MNNILLQYEAVKESKDRFYENRNREWGLYGADTGIHPLNMAIGGWIPKKLTVMAARSGMGKTALTPQMFQAGNRVQGGKRAEYLFFSWETDGSYIVDRNICNVASVTMRQLTQAAKLLGPKTIDKINFAYNEAKKLPVTYHLCSTNIDEVGSIFHDFSAECNRKSEEEEVNVLPVMVVDYIGLAEFTNVKSRTYDIADFVNGTKKLVNDEKGAACLLAQIKRSADEKEYPDRGDISDSQSIEQAADNLIILHRPEYNNDAHITDPETNEKLDSRNKAIFRKLKCRDAEVGDVIVGCDIKYCRFYDLAHNWDFPYWEQYKKKEFWINEFGLQDYAREY